MASRNKRNKASNSYVWRDKSLKEKDIKLKRIYFYNSSVRGSYKEDLRRELREIA